MRSTAFMIMTTSGKVMSDMMSSLPADSRLSWVVDFSAPEGVKKGADIPGVEVETVTVGCAADSAIVPVMLRPVEDRTGEAVRLDTFLHWQFWTEKAVSASSLLAGQTCTDEWVEQAVRPADGREAGDPLPFRMSSDGYISSLLLLCFFLSLLFVARSFRYLVVSVKDFFSTRFRENMFNELSDSRMQGKYFFALVACASLGVLLFDYQQTAYPDAVQNVSPYLLLGANVGMFLLGYGLRTALYAFVNSVFFDRERNVKWMEAYHLLAVAYGLVFLLAALLVVFFGLDFTKWLIIFLISLIVVEIFLIFKTFHIFFQGFLGILHLILYLCTLEFLPLLTLWKGMVWVTQKLTGLV